MQVKTTFQGFSIFCVNNSQNEPLEYFWAMPGNLLQAEIRKEPRQID